MIETAMNYECADNWTRTVELECLVFTNQKENSMSLQTLVVFTYEQTWGSRLWSLQSHPHELGLIYCLRHRNPFLLNIINSIFVNIFFGPKGWPSRFLDENAHTQNPFFEKFIPFLSSIYISTFIFT